MKRAYASSQYARPCERYCRETYPREAGEIFRKAEAYYLEFLKDVPDLDENLMAKNMLDWFTILAFYEASDHRLDGETLLAIKRRSVEKLKIFAGLIDGNKYKWPYRLFEKIYVRYDRMQKAHQARGEWLDSWKVEINPDCRAEGFCFHLVGCPICAYAEKLGVSELMPLFCELDAVMITLQHGVLHRAQTIAGGGDYCDYFITGDKE